MKKILLLVVCLVVFVYAKDSISVSTSETINDDGYVYTNKNTEPIVPIVLYHTKLLAKQDIQPKQVTKQLDNLPKEIVVIDTTTKQDIPKNITSIIDEMIDTKYAKQNNIEAITSSISTQHISSDIDTKTIIEFLKSISNKSLSTQDISDLQQINKILR